MSDIDDPSTPRFFSKQKSEMDDILSDIDNDLSDDVLDIDTFDDAPAEPLKASKPFRGSKSSFGGSLGGSNFMGGLSSSRQTSSSKLLMGTMLALLVVGGAGGAYYYFTQMGDYSSSPKIAPPLAPPSPQDMQPPMADGVMPDGTMPTPPPVDGAMVPPTPDAAAMNVDPNMPQVPPAEGSATPQPTDPAMPVLPQVASDVGGPITPPADSAAGTVPTTTLTPTTATPTPADAANAVNTPNATPAAQNNNVTAPVNSESKPENVAKDTAPVDATTTTPPLTPDQANKTAATDTNLPPLPQDGIIAPKADGAQPTDTATTANAKTELTAESKTDKVTKPSTKTEKIKYFDSPPGEILEDIQPPSIDVTRNPGESIIIVKKPVGYDRGYEDGAYSQSRDGSVKIERSEVTNSLTQKSIMADRALRLGRYDMALGYYQDILAQNPNDVSALLGRAISLQKLGNIDAAMQGYRDVLRRDSSNVTAATNLAGLQSNSDPNRALKNLSNVYQADPSNTSVKAQMGVSMAQSGDVEDAYKVFLSATQSDPRNPVHFYNLAVTAERLGKTSEAIAAYEKCLEVDAIYGTGRGINRDVIYDRLSKIRGQ